MNELRKQAKGLEPILRIGKHGVTPEMLAEIKMHLKKRKLIKIKMLPSFIKDHDKKKVVHDVVAFTESTLVYQTGFVFVLHRK